jgi:isochorismate synthase
MVGLGNAFDIEVTGPERFREAASRARDHFSNHLVRVQDPSGGLHESATADSMGPRMLGGFGFYDSEISTESEWREMGPGRLILPELLVVEDGISRYCNWTTSLDPGVEVEAFARSIAKGLESARATHEAFTGSGRPGGSTLPSIIAKARKNHEVERAADGPSLVLESAGEGPEYRVRSDRSHEQYCARVEKALDDIAAGKFSKVVLARSLLVDHDASFSLTGFMGSLEEIYPSCVVLAVRRGESCFVSATPERLVALHDQQITTGAIAGSAPRGRTPEEDTELGNHLLDDPKERREHDLVRQMLLAALADVCSDLSGPREPRLLRLEGIQHLESPLVGRLASHAPNHMGILDLVDRLHPTPAVAGTPREVALDWLERWEDLDRGWYAGPVGFVDSRGEGEFRVALRSGLIRGGVARLFAGAGIVEGSIPRRELVETRLKLRALLAPLTEI